MTLKAPARIPTGPLSILARKHGLDTTAFCKKAGISRYTLHQWNHHGVPANRIHDVAAALGCRIREVFRLNQAVRAAQQTPAVEEAERVETTLTHNPDFKPGKTIILSSLGAGKSRRKLLPRRVKGLLTDFVRKRGLPGQDFANLMNINSTSGLSDWNRTGIPPERIHDACVILKCRPATIHRLNARIQAQSRIRGSIKRITSSPFYKTSAEEVDAWLHDQARDAVASAKAALPLTMVGTTGGAFPPFPKDAVPDPEVFTDRVTGEDFSLYSDAVLRGHVFVLRSALARIRTIMVRRLDAEFAEVTHSDDK